MSISTRHEPVLRSLKLTLTEACNLACPYCYQQARSLRRMNLGTLRASLALARRLGRGRVGVVLSGGEPLLALDLVSAALEAAADQRVGQPRLAIRLLTNGTMLTAANLTRLVAADIELQVSCDGVAAAQDVRSPGSWPDLDGLLTAIRRQHPEFWRRRLSVAMTVTPQNVANLSESVAWAMAHDVRRLEVGLACGLTADWGRRSCGELVRQVERVFISSVEYLERAERVPVSFLRPLEDTTSVNLDACGAGDPASLAIDVDGGVHGCGMLADVARWHPSDRVRQAVAAFHLGNVAEPDLVDRWRDLAARPRAPMFPRADRTAADKACRDCELIDTCLICPVAGPDPRRAVNAHCEFERLSRRLRKAMPSRSPVATLLDQAGVSPRVGARLARMVWNARQEV